MPWRPHPSMRGGAKWWCQRSWSCRGRVGLSGGWARNGGRVSGSPKCGNVPNTEGRNGAILGRAKNGISRGVQQCRKPVILVLPRASRAEGGKGDRYLI